MRHFLFAVFLVVACATGAAAGPIEEAKSAHDRGNYALAVSDDKVRKATKHRDEMALQMTAAQIEKAQEMARRCQETKFKECD